MKIIIIITLLVHPIKKGLPIPREKVVEESDNLKNVAVLHDSNEESCGDDSACSDSGGSESDCKD